MPVAIRSSGGGATTLVATSSPTDYTTILPANSGTVVTTGSTAVVTQAMLGAGVAGNGPAFSVYGNGQTLPATITKVQLPNKVFDTANCFDNVTNYRFTPNVAGYYQFNAIFQAAVSFTAGNVFIYKNGAQAITGGSLNAGGGTFGVSFLIYMNGTTDYAEMYAYVGTSQATVAGNTFFQGFLVRAA
jgi:hypothetical protein